MPPKKSKKKNFKKVFGICHDHHRLLCLSHRSRNESTNVSIVRCHVVKVGRNLLRKQSLNLVHDHEVHHREMCVEIMDDISIVHHQNNDRIDRRQFSEVNRRLRLEKNARENANVIETVNVIEIDVIGHRHRRQAFCKCSFFVHVKSKETMSLSFQRFQKFPSKVDKRLY